MKKTFKPKLCILLSLLLLLVLANSNFPAARVQAANLTSANAMIDGFQVPYTANSGYPYIDANSRTQVPLRLTLESIGCKVAWNAANATAAISKGATNVVVSIGSSTIYRNNQAIPNDTTAVINPADGRTYLPIRVVLEAFGCRVGWNQENRTVLVDTQCSAAYAKALETTAIAYWNYWPNFNAAIAAYQNGSYALAIPKLAQAVCDLTVYGNDGGQNGQYTNLALAFFNLGTCQAKIGNYGMAASCYLRETDYWQLLYAEYAGVGDSFNANQAEQMIIAARRRADYCTNDISLYAVTSDPSLSLVKYYGEAGESKNGILLGAYAEAEKALSGNYTTFSNYVGKTHGAFLIYYSVGANIDAQYGLKQYIRMAQESNSVLQIALQPMIGMDYVLSPQGQTWLENFASYLATTGVPVYSLCLRNEPGKHTLV
ncbi:MAG TPA: stalk domain-containing protein [Bacillota bacterium]|nr:stalk domain-containing protein [Bacillota bacterium]